MSWSVYRCGKAEAVAAVVESDFVSQAKCVEPEETARQNARNTIATSLAGMPPDRCVRVSAWGHQYSVDGGKVVNTVSLKIEEMAGFVG